MKTLHCRDAGFNCPGIIRASTDEDVLYGASQHVFEVHGLPESPERVTQLKALIRGEL